MKKNLLLIVLTVSISNVYSQLVTPAQNDNLYSLEVGNVFFEVDANEGAHISSFKINNDEILYPMDGSAQHLWGSTFWPSPQSVWNWPPSTELDSDPYTAQIADNKIIMTSEKDPDSELVFEKTFFADLSDTSITIEYKIINEGSSSYSVAGWEVTRVPSGGLTFFPRGDGNLSGAFASQTSTIDGVLWYEHSSSDPSSQKFFCDGDEGWFAHVNEDEYLFIKTFEEVPSDMAAPGEAEIELWHQGPSSYIELENQSKYATIPSSSDFTYSVKWLLREIPGTVNVSEGSDDLLEFTRLVALGPQISASLKNTTPVIAIQPNPAAEYITVEHSSESMLKLEIHDITGKKVLETAIIQSGQRVPLNELNSGLYFYKIESETTARSGKLVVR